MTGSARRNTLILFGLVMIITAIIAASLPRLELQPGMPLPRLVDNQVVSESAATQPRVIIPVGKFFGIFFTVILAGSVLYIIYKLIRGARREDFISFIRPLVVISLIAGGIVFLLLLLPGSGDLSTSTELSLPTPVPPITAPLGTPPSSLFWLVGIGLFLAVLLVGVWIWSSSSRRAMPVDLLGLEAEKAWQALKTGLDLKDVILRCYRQMSLALEHDRGIERKEFMTTGEFENLLEAAGIPHEPIHQLTRLFDAVRYGNWQPNPADEHKALQCLEAIMRYSRETRVED